MSEKAVTRLGSPSIQGINRSSIRPLSRFNILGCPRRHGRSNLCTNVLKYRRTHWQALQTPPRGQDSPIARYWHVETTGRHVDIGDTRLRGSLACNPNRTLNCLHPAQLSIGMRNAHIGCLTSGSPKQALARNMRLVTDIRSLVLMAAARMQPPRLNETEHEKQNETRWSGRDRQSERGKSL